VQQALLETLLRKGHNTFHESVQALWPLDPQAAFGALPTPLRMHADPRFSGTGVTVAFVDAGFHPHPDLTRPVNRIRAWADVGASRVQSRIFSRDESPTWPGWDGASARQWHGLMTSTVAAGNGWLARGFYRGLAGAADVVLVQALEADGRITNAGIARALAWLLERRDDLGIRVVSLSVAGDPVSPPGNPVDEAVRALTERGVLVLSAAGNDGERRLVPPATAPEALTVGGLDDRNTIDHDEWTVWHSNYGETAGHAPKPEVVAPSLWVVAPVLPGSEVARESERLFAHRAVEHGSPSDERRAPRQGVEGRIAELKLVTPHYQHVEGTSFAAPLVASVAACMLEANPSLGPRRLRELIIAAAQSVSGASPERQGAGAVDAGRAVTLALADRHSRRAEYVRAPLVSEGSATFLLHDHDAGKVEVLGSWNGWQSPGRPATEVEPGLWEARLAPVDGGRHAYKFLLDGRRWLTDPANPARVADGLGGWNSLLEIPAP
jgi:serine protease AprX